jgi:hypothetical protein
VRGTIESEGHKYCIIRYVPRNGAKTDCDVEASLHTSVHWELWVFVDELANLSLIILATQPRGPTSGYISALMLRLVFVVVELELLFVRWHYKARC